MLYRSFLKGSKSYDAAGTASSFALFLFFGDLEFNDFLACTGDGLENRFINMFKKKRNEPPSEIESNILSDYRKHLIKVMEGNTDRFEKQLSYISAGSLGISMAFIKDVVGSLNDTNNNWLVMVGWSAMGFTLLLNLVSQVYANHCHSNTIEDIECRKYNSNRAGRRRNRIMWMNYCSIATLICGVIFLLIFISKNIA